jgi:hypothetical protein
MLRNSRLHYLPLDPSTGMVSSNFGGSSASSQSSLSAPVPPVNSPGLPRLPKPLQLIRPSVKSVLPLLPAPTSSVCVCVCVCAFCGVHPIMPTERPVCPRQ